MRTQLWAVPGQAGKGFLCASLPNTALFWLEGLLLALCEVSTLIKRNAIQDGSNGIVRG